MTSPTLPHGPNPGSPTRGAFAVCLVALVGGGCVFTPPPPLPEELAAQKSEEQARIERLRAGKAQSPEGEAGGEGPRFVAGDEPELGMTDEELREYATAQGDPEGGDFTLEEATEGMTGSGQLWARIVMVDGGVMECELLADAAPRTVANFVGLARGKRATRDEEGTWAAKPYFDGTVFHRVIEGFMIQGGDPTGTGTGNTGYVLPDELGEGLFHDHPGLLSMANRGPTTGSAQFFVTLAPTPHLDGKHAIFGRCTEASITVAEKIAATGGAGDRPTTPQTIKTVEIAYR